MPINEGPAPKSVPDTTRKPGDFEPSGQDVANGVLKLGAPEVPAHAIGEHFVHQVKQADRWVAHQADDNQRHQHTSRMKPVPEGIHSEYGEADKPHPGIWLTGAGHAPEGHILDIANKLVGYTHFEDAPPVRDLEARDLYRSYKHTPHAPASTFLKYLVHRFNHAAEYDDPATGHKLDVEFRNLVQHGRAAEKNGHVSIAQLHDWTRRWAPDIMPGLLEMRDATQDAVARGVGLSTRSINGEPYVALTRGLDSEMMTHEHPLSSHADKPETGFGKNMHHSWVPLRDLWFSYDLGDRYASGSMGPEDEWLVSNSAPRYQATPEDVKHNRVGDAFDNFLDEEPGLKNMWLDSATDADIANGIRSYYMTAAPGSGAPNHHIPPALLAHRSAGPETYKAALQHSQGSLPRIYHSLKMVPREHVLNDIAANGMVSSLASFKNPNLTGEDLVGLSKYVLDPAEWTPNKRKAVEAWMDAPAMNSHILERAWRAAPVSPASAHLLTSPLATPTMLQAATDQVAQGYYNETPLAANDLAKAVAQNPHHTPEQAQTLYDWMVRAGLYENGYNGNILANAAGSLKLSGPALEDVAKRASAPLKWPSFEHSGSDAERSRTTASNILANFTIKNPHAAPMLAKLAAEGRVPVSRLEQRLERFDRLEPALQSEYIRLADEYPPGTTANWSLLITLAHSKGLSQETVNALAHYPSQEVRDAVFRNKSVTPEQIREAYPKDFLFPEEDPNLTGRGYPFTESRVADEIAQAYHRRRNWDARMLREHLVKPLPQNLAKSEDDLWQAQARDWLAQQKVKGFYYPTTIERAQNILRDEAIEPEVTDELLHGEAVFAHRASPTFLDHWHKTAGPDDVVLYFETPAAPEPHDDGRFYWTNRVPVENAHLVDIAPGDAPLAKMHTPLLFPRLGIGDDRRETKLVSTPGERQTFFRAAAARTAFEEPGQKTGKVYKRLLDQPAQGATFVGNKTFEPPFSSSMAMTPSAAPRKTFSPEDAKQMRDPQGLPATAAHEDLHRMFGRVQHKFGVDGRFTLARNLLDALPRDLRGAVLDHFHGQRPWLQGQDEADEEAITELGSYLNQTVQRDQFHKQRQDSPEQQRAFHDKMKRAYRLLQVIASTADERWVTRRQPWLRKGEATVPFHQPQGPAGLSAQAAHEVFKGSLKLSKSYPDLADPNTFAFEFEVNPTLYKAVEERYVETELRKMALIHDDPEKPMKVWRVQSEGGLGPYEGGPHEGDFEDRNEYLEARQKHYDMMEGIRLNAPNEQPIPHEDFPKRDLSGLRFKRFAFERPEHATAWFGKEGLKELKRAGFVLQQVLASKVWRSKSGRQLVYTPHQSVKKAESTIAVLPTEKVFDPGEESAAKAMLGHRPEHERCLAAARFLTGRKAEVDEDMFRLALGVYDGDPERAALVAVGLTDSQANLRALRAALKLGEFSPDHVHELTKNEPGSPHIEDIRAGAPDASDTAAEVARAATAGLVQPLVLGGKHSKGSMAVRDPKTGNVWLLKPGSGKQSPAAGARDDGSSQSAREAAFWHVADRLGLGNYYPRADLLLVNGAQVAAMKLLGSTWKSLDERNRQVDGYAREVLAPYLKRGDVHRLALLDWILGNPDSHGQNWMVHAEAIAGIDHGSAFAGPGFDPGHDSKSFTPYPLRVFASSGYSKKKPEERVQSMPSLDREQDAEFRKWVRAIDPALLVETMSAHDIGEVAQKAVVARLDALQRYAGPSLSAYLNGLWAGTES